MPDTLAANIAENYTELVVATMALLPQEAPMINLVERITITKGHGTVELPRVNSTFTVQTPTEGDELVSSSQFALTSTTITPTLRAIRIRVSGRAEYFSSEDTMAMVSKELARAQAQDIDTDLTAEFANFGAGNNVGTTNVDLDFDIIQTARRLLVANTAANGGPAPQPIYFVLSPLVEEDLFADLGSIGLLGSNYIPTGLTQDIMINYHIPQNRIAGVQMFRDGYMTEDGSSDFICGLFSKIALQLAMSKNWDVKVFDESSWIGPVIRSVADYNAGVGRYPLHGSEVTADGA